MSKHDAAYIEAYQPREPAMSKPATTDKRPIDLAGPDDYDHDFKMVNQILKKYMAGDADSLNREITAALSILRAHAASLQAGPASQPEAGEDMLRHLAFVMGECGTKIESPYGDDDPPPNCPNCAAKDKCEAIKARLSAPAKEGRVILSDKDIDDLVTELIRHSRSLAVKKRVIIDWAKWKGIAVEEAKP